jgi:hypothetical protein
MDSFGVVAKEFEAEESGQIFLAAFKIAEPKGEK